MRCRRVEDLLPLHVGGDLEPELGAAVAEHLRSCLSCARALRGHQQALAAFQSLRELEPARVRGGDAGARPGTSGGSVLWERVRAQMHAAPESAQATASFGERVRELAARVPQRWRIALAAGLLGASLLALGMKLSAQLGGGSTAGDLRGQDSLHQVRTDERQLQDAGVLDPARSLAPRDLERGSRGSHTHFVGRVGPNSNY